MYYCIHLSDQHTGTIDQNGTNTVRSIDTKQGNATLTWQLLDNSTVNKFVDITKSVALSDSRVIDWNYYRTDNISLPSLVEQLNSAIDAYPLPSDYKILLTDNKELVYEQTNRVHYAFEKLLVESNPSNKQKEILEVQLKQVLPMSKKADLQFTKVLRMGLLLKMPLKKLKKHRPCSVQLVLHFLEKFRDLWVRQLRNSKMLN